MAKLVVTLAGHGQLVKPMTPTETLRIRLPAVSHAGNSQQEGQGLMKSCFSVQWWCCFMQSWEEMWSCDTWNMNRQLERTGKSRRVLRNRTSLGKEG